MSPVCPGNPLFLVHLIGRVPEQAEIQNDCMKFEIATETGREIFSTLTVGTSTT